MKNFIKYILQSLLGYKRYLFVFARYKINNLKSDRKEKDFFAFLNAIEKEGDLLDVGANIGIMTIHLAQKFPNRKIYSIEPVPSNIEVLYKVIAKYKVKNVEVITSAVGNKDGEEVSMILPEQGKVKMQGLAHIKHDSITEWNDGIEFKVKSETLDTLFTGIKIVGIKMDIENYESFALEGAQKLISAHQPVIYLELWDNDNRTKCFDTLLNLGYSAFVNSESGLKPFDPKTDHKQNFIFVHQADQ
ncbi:FkbM family methyltransferase [Paracrocinitomix mangrovi]|uniref:FkbM family methyltransferase n=1 Tax=Paracrocinitomix mangrovi TaxID=2862509 RepID=UPI001C8D746A|nr:FkbM family methyltransferase [Paracrocinitomix mangrovi]UKN02959.1 FkbM family methyltransferase [Paracrocinitomix mangrovi]